MPTRAVGIPLAALFFGAVAAAQQGQVQLDLVRTIQAEGGVIHAASFSPDGKWLATAGELGDLRMLEAATGKVLWNEKPGDHWSGVVAFSPDGERVACRGRHLTIHDATTGKERFRVEGIGPQGFAWLPDGRGFAYARGNALVVDQDGRAVVRASFEYPINTIAAGDVGDLWVGDNVGRVWRVLDGDDPPVLQCDHRQGDRLVRSVRLCVVAGVLFDLASKGPLRRGLELFDVPATPFALAVARDGRSFAVGGDESRSEGGTRGQAVVRWWRDGGTAFDDLVVTGSVAALAFHPDGTRLFVSTYEGGQALHERGREPVELPGPSMGEVRQAILTPDGSVVAVRGKRWSLHPLDGGPVRPMPRVLFMQRGHVGAQLVAQERSRYVVFDARSGEELQEFPSTIPHSRCSGMAGPPGLYCIDGVLVDGSGAEGLELPGSVLIHNFSEVAFAPDGRWAIGGVCGIEGEGGSLVITDATGKTARLVDDEPIYSVAFSPDGRKLFYSCGSGLSFGSGPPNSHLRIRDAETLELLTDLRRSIGTWRFLDGNRALVGSSNGLQVWDVEKLAPLQDLPINCRSFELSADRRTLVVAHADGVRVYRVTID